MSTYASKVLFFSVILENYEKFHFSHSKMAENYAKINRVGSLDADFQQVPLVIQKSNLLKKLYRSDTLLHLKNNFAENI